MALAADLESIAARMKPWGEEGIAIAETIMNHPEGPAVLADVARVCGYSVPPGTLTAFAAGFKGFLGAVRPADPATPLQAKNSRFYRCASIKPRVF
jgi:hypothetical protein